MKNTIYAKIILILCLLLWVTSCAHFPNFVNVITHKNLPHTNPEPYFPNTTVTFSECIQPLHIACPLCKSEGLYIQSIFVVLPEPSTANTNILYSQYVCTNSHEWLIKQKIVDGPVLPKRLLLKYVVVPEGKL